MGSRNPDRIMRLRQLRTSGPGYLWLAVCGDCGHLASLPVQLLIKRYGELYPVEMAMIRMRCSECQSTNVSPRLARLCDPGCGRMRG